MGFGQQAVLDLFDKVVSHALQLGLFERVGTHEPKNAPGNGLTCAIWVQRIHAHSSGLAATSGVVSLTVRAYASMLTLPYDEIDPNLMTAALALMNAYTGDLNFGGQDGTRNVDLLAESGESLSWQAGYIQIDGQTFRVIDINLPVIVNDMFVQVTT